MNCGEIGKNEKLFYLLHKKAQNRKSLMLQQLPALLTANLDCISICPVPFEIVNPEQVA
jgi:hypothetical protein